MFEYEKNCGLSLQIFIVNNSHQESCKELEQKFSVKVLESEQNKGFGGGHNSVLSFINSKYHIVLNPDILFKEPILNRLIKYLDDNPEIGALAPLIVDAKGNVQDVYRKELAILDLICRYAPFPFCAFPACKKRNSLHTMKNVDKRSPFECEWFFMYAEDADLCKRIRLAGRKVVCFPGGKVVHKWEKASHRSFKLCRIHFTSLAKYFYKWKFTRGGEWLAEEIELVPLTSYSLYGFAHVGRSAA